tara:strand:- start:1089 stop:2027 length:939 start_codon:yes stop_codon:yes gene_type:complete
MANIDSYQYTQLTEENVHHLIPLFEGVFGITFTRDHLIAKFFTPVQGVCAQGHFAFFQGEPIAYHGCIPILMEYRGEAELSFQYGDAMTLPEHAGKGLFTKLGKLTDEILPQLGAGFVWGFPNQNSEYGYVNKLQWKGEKRMKCFTIPVATLPTEKIFRRTKVFEKQNQDRIRRKLSDSILVNKPIQSVDTTRNVGVSRNLAYFDYKSYTSNFCVDVDGTAVWIKPVGGLLVGDMEVNSQEQVLKTVEGLKRMAQKIGVDKVIIQVSEANPIYNFLSIQYSSIDSWLIGYKNISSNFPLETLDLTYGDLDTF